ncbi:MAG: PLP-dependent aminotransferase family protein [Anaerolineae bacterium]|jgi:2-aminoadipate transaminase|nr:PLP-dependent aminotransferase family protein [Anaerolineae bacterium]
MATLWKSRYAQRTQRMGRSVIRELLKYTQQPDLISFAGGLPAPELFPIAEAQAAACRVLSEGGIDALQYGPTEGFVPLRQFIVDRMARYGIRAKAENVVITNGSQQALDLIGKLLLNPGDRILVEEPTYLGALQAWNAYQAEYISVPSDDDGLRTELLEAALRVGPKFMYVLPNFQNPGGTTLPLERRLEVVRLSNKYGIPVVEDDPYGALRFEGEHLPPLVALDSDFQTNAGSNGRGYMEGNVIYLGTFSKTLAPGLRLGWVVAPVEIIDQLVMAKQGVDLHTATFNQMLAWELVKDGFMDEHVRVIRRVYGERRDVMLAALERHFPEGCSWTHPEGGLFLWARVPEWIDTAELLQEAVQFKVAYVPGFAFYAESGHGRNTMRLNFSNAQPAQIEEGIRRLGELLKKEMAQSPH